MKKWTCLFILLLASAPVFSQFDSTADTVDLKKHAVQMDPVGIIGGAAGLNYEYRFMPRHSIFMEGAYVFPLFQKTKGYGANVQYRFRFQPLTRSNFVGIFLKANYTESSVLVNRATYDYSFKTKVVGVNYGFCKRLFKTKLDYEYHLGVGVPFSTFTWKNGRPEKIGTMYTKTFENIFKYVAMLDAGLSFGVSF